MAITMAFLCKLACLSMALQFSMAKATSCCNIDANGMLTTCQNCPTNSLDLNGKGITDIQNGAFSDTSNLDLVTLKLSRNSLTSIRKEMFVGLNNLETLFINDNDLEAFPEDLLENTPKVRRLEMDDNSITSLPEDFLYVSRAHLSNLRVDRNRIEEIPLHFFDGLGDTLTRRIELEDNEIVFLPRSIYGDLTNIVDVRLNGNPGETICPPQTKPKGWHDFELETITIDNTGQPVSDLGVRFCYADPIPPTPTAAPTVSPSYSPRANVGCCVFWDTTLIKCQCDMSYLDLSNMNIETIEDGAFDFSENQNILTVNLNKNSLDRVQNSVFVGLNSLRTLSLGWNNLRYIEEASFCGLFNLENLVLSYNALEDVNRHAFEGNNKIRTIFINDNKLVSFYGTVFDPVPFFNALKADRNKIEALPQTIFQYQNALAYIDFGRSDCPSTAYDNPGLFACPKIAPIHVQQGMLFESRRTAGRCGDLDFCYGPGFCCDLYNTWEEFHDPIRTLSNCHCAGPKLNLALKEIDEIAPYTWADPINEGVIKLYLQRNKLTHLVNGTFYNLPNLITLSLGDNYLEGIERGALCSLDSLLGLYMGNNVFYDVDTRSFSDLESIETINIRDNFLSILTPFAEESMTTLESLYLQRNKLVKISGNTFEESGELMFLDLDGNPPKGMCTGGNANGTLSQLSFTCSDSQLPVCLGDNAPQPPKQPKCGIPDESQYARALMCAPPCLDFVYDFFVGDFGLVNSGWYLASYWRGYKFRLERNTNVTTVQGGSTGDHVIFRLGANDNDIIQEVVASGFLLKPVTLSADQYYFLAVKDRAQRVTDINVNQLKEELGMSEWLPHSGTLIYELLYGDSAENMVGKNISAAPLSSVMAQLGFQGASVACP